MRVYFEIPPISFSLKYIIYLYNIISYSFIKKLLIDINDSSEKKLLENYLSDINKHNWEVLGRLGQGEYSKIYLILDKGEKRFCCLKIVNLSRFPQKQLIYNEIQEAELKPASIFSEKLIGIYNSYNKNLYGLEMEYFPSIAIHKIWNKLLNFGLKEKIVLLKNILEGIKILHKFGFIHRNINAKKILIDILDTQDIKIIDFGLCIESNKIKLPGDLKVGNKNIFPPESFFNKLPAKYNSISSDIWSYGILAYQILGNIKNPFEHLNTKIDQGALPDGLDESFKNILDNSMSSDPFIRPDIQAIHNVLQGFLRKYCYIENNHLHKELERLLSNEAEKQNLCIEVETENDTARVYLKNSVLAEVEYKKLDALEALKDILDNDKILYNVESHMNPQDMPEQNPQLCKYDAEALILTLNSRKEKVNTYRKFIQQSIKEIFRVIDNKVRCKLCNKEYSFDELLYRTNIFLFGSNHQKLAPYCKNCIIKISKKGHKGHLKTLKKHTIAACYKLFHAEYYMGFETTDKGTCARICILYINPGVNSKSWDVVLKRLAKGYKILAGYPSAYFSVVKKFNMYKNKDIYEKSGILVHEYFPGITLKQFFANCNSYEIEFQVKAGILYELAKALQIMHSNHIVHRNVNPSTIMLSLTGQIKLTDFSLCKYTNEGYDLNEDFYFHTINLTKQYPAGVRSYIAPEQIINMAGAGKKSDIWSWGIVAYELFTGTHPLKKKDRSLDYSGIPQECRSLVEQALEHEETKRCSAQNIVETFENIIFSRTHNNTCF